jgi:hypothetical protein
MPARVEERAMTRRTCRPVLKSVVKCDCASRTAQLEHTHLSHDDSMMVSRSKSQDDDSMMTSLPAHTTHTVILSVWISRDKERACQPVLKTCMPARVKERGEVRVEMPNSNTHTSHMMIGIDSMMIA